MGHVTLRNTSFYQSWGIIEQALSADLVLSREIEFNAKEFVGYECCRTASGELFRKAPSTDDAITYCFALAPSHPRHLKHVIPTPEKKPKKKKPKKPEAFYCDICDVRCGNQKKWNGHVNSP